jgi:hypothetical protein
VKAVAAFREAPKDRTCEKVPLNWATTQNNLGSALEAPGERGMLRHARSVVRQRVA